MRRSGAAFLAASGRTISSAPSAELSATLIHNAVENLSSGDAFKSHALLGLKERLQEGFRPTSQKASFAVRKLKRERLAFLAEGVGNTELVRPGRYV
jgi:hypothetical protein